MFLKLHLLFLKYLLFFLFLQYLFFSSSSSGSFSCLISLLLFFNSAPSTSCSSAKSQSRRTNFALLSALIHFFLLFQHFNSCIVYLLPLGRNKELIQLSSSLSSFSILCHFSLLSWSKLLQRCTTNFLVRVSLRLLSLLKERCCFLLLLLLLLDAYDYFFLLYWKVRVLNYIHIKIWNVIHIIHGNTHLHRSNLSFLLFLSTIYFKFWFSFLEVSKYFLIILTRFNSSKRR